MHFGIHARKRAQLTFVSCLKAGKNTDESVRWCLSKDRNREHPHGRTWLESGRLKAGNIIGRMQARIGIWNPIAGFWKRWVRSIHERSMWGYLRVDYVLDVEMNAGVGEGGGRDGTEVSER